MNKVVLLTSSILLTGCTMMPFYHRPKLPVENQWPAGSGLVSGASLSKSASDLPWREFFQDPQLQRIIELALANNRDLRIAALNVEAVRAQYRIGTATMIPNIRAESTALRQKQPTTKDGEFETSGKYAAGLGISSYEIDFFGRVRSLKRRALENYLATEEARRSAQMSLISQVAIQYLTVLQAEEALSLTKQTLRSQEEYYQLIKKSYEVGSTSELDLRSVQSQVQIAKVNAAQLIRERAQALDALVFLVGCPLPASLPPTRLLRTENFLTDLPAGLPSDLLQRRPDILAAEHQLKGANANVGAARAAFFPKITLTGSGGYASLSLVNLFNPAGPAWSFSPQVTMPIFDSGATKIGLDLAEINKRIEIAQYEKAIQTAFREVADALAAKSSLQNQVQAQKELVEAQEKRHHLADLRYRNGIDSYLNVLSAQEDLYNAQQNYVKVRFSQLANLITLYMVLGGGWQ